MSNLKLKLLELEVLLKTFERVKLEYVYKNGRIFSIALKSGVIQTLPSKVFDVIRGSSIFKEVRHERIRYLNDYPKSTYSENPIKCIEDVEFAEFTDHIRSKAIKQYRENLGDI
jgi:hypothetical protein